jgi:multiple sugar transport system substrate-binding protein
VSHRQRNWISGAMALLLAASMAACGSGGSGGTAVASNAEPEGKITVWDYYGTATPVKPAIAAFTKAHPKVTIDYQAYDYNTMAQKYAVAVSSGTAPDVATLDMTWIPTYASNGTLADLTELSGGKVNGQPFETLWSPGAREAMTADGHYVTALYDFDAYSLYYRADLFDSLKVSVPTTWQQLNDAAAKLSAGDPKKQRFMIRPDTFHYSQFLFQAGGAILTPDNKQAAFASPEGEKALEEYAALLKAGGIYWGAEQGDISAGIKDGRIAMFLDGPYLMGILKSAAPDQSGKWKVAPAPTDAKPGSYLGGTGLSIPVNSKNKDAAWAFTQFLLRTEQELGVAKYAGAAPATTPALQSAELTKPDPYFGGQAPFSVFLQAQSSATHFPYVKQWSDIDKAITDAVTAVLLGKKTSAAALADAAKEVNSLLG